MSRTCPMCGQWHEVKVVCNILQQRAHLAMQFHRIDLMNSATQEENRNIQRFNNWRDGHGDSPTAA